MTRENERYERQLESDLYGKETLSLAESELVLSFIVLARKLGTPYLTVKQLAEFWGKDPSTARAFLNRLKRKGIAVDVCKRYEGNKAEAGFENLLRELGLDTEVYYPCPRGGKEKGWKLIGLNPLDDKNVIKYLEEERPEVLLRIYENVRWRYGEGALSFEEFKRRIYYKALGIKSYMKDENK